MRRADSFEKTLVLGKLEGRRRRARQRWGDWMASPTRWTWAWVSSGSWWWTGRPDLLQSMVSQRVRRDWVTELNWTEALFRASLAPLLRRNLWDLYLMTHLFNEVSSLCLMGTRSISRLGRALGIFLHYSSSVNILSSAVFCPISWSFPFHTQD